MSMEATEELLLAAVAQRFPDLTPAELSAALQEATGGADWNANANSRHMKSETGWRPKPSSLSRRRPLVPPGERRATEWGHLAEVREEAAESARLMTQQARYGQTQDGREFVVTNEQGHVGLNFLFKIAIGD